MVWGDVNEIDVDDGVEESEALSDDADAGLRRVKLQRWLYKISDKNHPTQFT